MMVGVPYAPISVPYSLMSSDFGKLKSIIEILTPGLVFVADGKPFARAIEAAVPLGVEIVVTANPLGEPAGDAVRRTARERADRRGRCRPRQGRARHDRENPVHLGLDRLSQGRHQHPAHAVRQPGDDPRRRLPSSPTSRRCWSTGRRGTTPSAATTISAWCSYNGGSFYIDEGKPLPGAIEATVRNLREIAPTIYLQRAEGLRDAAAVSAQPTRHCGRTSSAASRCCSTPARAWRSTSGTNCRRWRSPPRGERIIFLSSLGSTETAPAALARTWESEQPGNIGVPMRGRRAEARAERRQARSAATRARTSRRATGGGPTSPRTPSTTKAIYKIGDALRFDGRQPIPARACVFDGRLAEDFKLASGTWVSAGALRAQFIDHCAPLRSRRGDRRR